MTRRQRLRLMLGLLCLWAATSLVVFGVSSEPIRVPLQNVTGAVANASGTRGESRSPGLQVNVKLFEAGRMQRAQQYPPPRNIFVAASAAEASGQVARTDIADVGPQPSVDVGVAGQDPVSVQYLGFVDVERAGPRGTVAVVATGDELHMVRAGEGIGDQFVVKAVTAEALIAIQRATGLEVRFPLSEMLPVETAS